MEGIITMTDAPSFNARKILILGCSGAGKSTLARVLADRLGLPLIHLDRLWWRPGWVERDPAEFDAELAEVLAGDRWIIDGNFSRTLHTRLQAADCAILLDYPRRKCLAGIFRRFLQYRGRTRPDLTEGCPERIDWEFFCFVWNFRKLRLPPVLEKLAAAPPSCRVIILHSPRETEQFLRGLGSPAAER